VKRVVWIVSLIAVSGISAAFASTCPAHVWLGKQAKTRDTFFFGASGTCEPIEIFSIQVGPVGGGEPICIVHAPSPGSTPVLESGWIYGSVPNGFVERKKCKPLKPGQTYRISVVGSCVGERFFRVDKLGHLKMSTSLKGEELRCGPKSGPGHL